MVSSRGTVGIAYLALGAAGKTSQQELPLWGELETPAVAEAGLEV